MMLVHQVLRAEKAARLAFQKKKKTWPFSVEDLPEALGNVNGQVGN